MKRSTVVLAVGALAVAALAAWSFRPRPVPVETRLVGLALF